jgi:CheY-like chemotaxis protein
MMTEKKAVILLVEDNADHAELVIRSLSDASITQIIHLCDGEMALDYILRRNQYARPESSPLPHLVLLDLRLPRVDGLEVLRTIKQSNTLSHVPVVVLTTSNATSDIAQAYEYHANSYLVKPVGFDEFSQLMQTITAYWLKWNTHLKE